MMGSAWNGMKWDERWFDDGNVIKPCICPRMDSRLYFRTFILERIQPVYTTWQHFKIPYLYFLPYFELAFV